MVTIVEILCFRSGMQGHYHGFGDTLQSLYRAAIGFFNNRRAETRACPYLDPIVPWHIFEPHIDTSSTHLLGCARGKKYVYWYEPHLKGRYGIGLISTSLSLHGSTVGYRKFTGLQSIRGVSGEHDHKNVPTFSKLTAIFTIFVGIRLINIVASRN